MTDKSTKHQHQYIKACCECKSHNLRYDELHDELYCHDCGLVLVAPSCSEIDYPGYLLMVLLRK